MTLPIVVALAIPLADGNRADFSSPFTATVPPLPKDAIEDPDKRPGAG